MESPSVAVVILNWNGKNYLERFLPSVIKTSYPNLKIIVGDNASTDDSLTFIQTNFPQVLIIKNEMNEGFAKGYNSILEKVEASYFILLNSDVEVTENWIHPVIDIMESNPNIAACQPKIKDWNHRSGFEYAGAAGGWIDRMGYAFCRGRIFENIEEDNGQYDQVTDIFWASGAAMFIRSSVFKECGGFDPYFFAHMEEIDLCWRIQRKGYLIKYIPESVVYHVGGGTLKKGNPLKTYLNYRNNLVMLSKNLTLRLKIFIIPFRMILDAISAIRLLFNGNIDEVIAVIKAHFSYLQWEWNVKKKEQNESSAEVKLKGLYTGNIVWQYFVKGKRTFIEIVGSRN